MSTPKAKPLARAFLPSLENALLFNLWIRADFLLTSREGETPSLGLRGSFHQTLWACQLPQFTFSRSLASKNASRNVGSQSIFLKPFSKSEVLTEASDRLKPALAFTHGKQLYWIQTLLGIHAPREKCDFYPSFPSDRLPENPCFISTPILHDSQKEVTDPSLSVINLSWARRGATSQPVTESRFWTRKCAAQPKNNNNCWRSCWRCRRSRCCSARILRMLMRSWRQQVSPGIWTFSPHCPELRFIYM